MTDSEKLNLILSEMHGMKDEIRDMKTDIRNMNTEMQNMKTDIRDMNTEMQNMKTDISTFKVQTLKSISELKSMDEMILDEVERVHGILDRHKNNKTIHTAEFY